VKGYQAAIQERSLATCPYQEQSIMAYHWSRGWREGREDYWNGFNQASFQQKAASL
jgi:ribosome modulation factor